MGNDNLQHKTDTTVKQGELTELNLGRQYRRGARVIKLHAQQPAGLIAPAACHIPHCVTAAPQHQHGYPKGAQELHAVRMPLRKHPSNLQEPLIGFVMRAPRAHEHVHLFSMAFPSKQSDDMNPPLSENLKR
jgi:hypothetical protein